MVHYAVVVLVYTIMFAVTLWHIRAPRHPPTSTTTFSRGGRGGPLSHAPQQQQQDFPPKALQTLCSNSLTHDILESRMLQDALVPARRVLLVSHPVVARALSPTTLKTRYRISHLDTIAIATPSSSSTEAMSDSLQHERATTRTLITMGRRHPRSYDVVYSRFGANCRDALSLRTHVRLLWSCTVPENGIVVARLMLRHRSDRDAVVSCFEHCFDDVRYGMTNYALQLCAHATSIMTMLWHDVRYPASQQEYPFARKVRWGEWWSYGQLFVVARKPRGTLGAPQLS